MYIEVFNTNFERVAVCDNYESLIWTDRYNDIGDFELYFPMRTELLDIYVPDYYLVATPHGYDGIRDSEYTMIIEDLKITTDLDGGNHLIVTGRSLESILCRRIVWQQTTVKGKLQNAVKKLVTENAIDPKYPKKPNGEKEKRKISNLIFEENSEVSALTIDETQYTGDVLYDAIKALCDVHDVGFSIKKNDQNQFIFKLYIGVDRSYKQTDNTYVVFSPTFDNIISSDYTENKSKYCNITLVAGEGEGSERKTAIVGNRTVTGIDRRELFTDARDISSKIENDEGESETMSDAEYTKVLENRGKEKLKEVEIEKTFDGQVEATQLYRYGEHFFMGDFCELENEYGKETRVKVIEYIHSESTSGIEEYPTFKVVEEEEE